MAVFAFYNFLFSLVTANFWFTRLYNLGELVESAVSIGRYPLVIFKNELRFFFTFLVPVALCAYYPVMIILGRAGPEVIGIAFIIDLVTFGFSQWFWHFALKHYQSASS